MTSVAEVVAYLGHVNKIGQLSLLNDKAFPVGSEIVCVFGLWAEAHFDAASDVGVRDRILSVANTYYERTDLKPNLLVQGEVAVRLPDVSAIGRTIREGERRDVYYDPVSTISFYMRGVRKGFRDTDPSTSQFSATINGASYRLNGLLSYHDNFRDGSEADDVKFFLHVCAATRAHYAVAGAGLLFSRYSASNLARCYPLYRRFPGLTSPDASAFSLLTVKRRDVIRDVNWLTAIGDDMLERIGGRDQIRLEAGEDVVLHDYADGVVLQAGERPKLGDFNIGDVPEPYRAVNRILKKLKFEDYRRPYFINTPEMIDEEQATRDWITRFD